MSKELSSLKALSKLFLSCRPEHQLSYKERYQCKKIIKKALKDSGKIKKINYLLKVKLDKVSDEKLKLKQALEILKEWFEVFKDEYGYHLRTLFDIGRINKEQFDLLKEVLK